MDVSGEGHVETPFSWTAVTAIWAESRRESDKKQESEANDAENDAAEQEQAQTRQKSWTSLALSL